MFESILIRKTDAFGSAMDAGFLAEGLLFYKQTIFAMNRGVLLTLLKTIGPDDLIGLIEDGHLVATFFENDLGTHTDVKGGLAVHNFIMFELVGNKTDGKLSREEKLAALVVQATGDTRHSKRIARRLMACMAHRKLKDVVDDPVGITGIAFRDLDDKEYVLEAVKRILATYAPVYAASHQLDFEIGKLANGFIVASNINYDKVNAEFNQTTPSSVATLTPSLICNHLLEARGDMLMSAKYLSELVSSTANTAIIELKFQHLLSKHEKNAREVEMFQDVFLDGRALREAINSGARSFSDFRKLLNNAQRFKTWLGDVSPDQKLIAEYQKAAIADTWIDSLPIKALRFAICTGIGFANPGAGLGASAVDMFLVDKIFRGWRPHHFVQGALTKFVE